MASLSLFVFFVLSHLLLLHSAEGENRIPPNCSFHCGNLIIGFPFYNLKYPICDGSFLEVNCDGRYPTTQLEGGGRPYEVIKFSYTNTTQSTTRIKDPLLSEHLKIRNCEFLTTWTFPIYPSPSISYEITSPKQTLFKCNRTLDITSPKNFTTRSCGDYNIYYSQSNHSSSTSLTECSIIHLPQNKHPDKDELFSLLGAEFDLEVHLSDDPCGSCHARGGLCDFRKEEDKEIFYCVEKKGNESIHNRISGAFELVLKVLSITLLT